MTCLLFLLVFASATTQSSEYENRFDCEISFNALTKLYPFQSTSASETKVLLNGIAAKTAELAPALEQFFDGFLSQHSLSSLQLSIPPCPANDDLTDELKPLTIDVISNPKIAADLCSLSESYVRLTLSLPKGNLTAQQLAENLIVAGVKTLSQYSDSWCPGQGISASTLRRLSSCEDDQRCTDCQANGCYQCATGYYLALNRVCVSCKLSVPYCARCNADGSKCQECDNGYYLHLNQCMPGHSIPQCIDYAQGQCFKCKAGYYLQNQLCVACSTFDPDCTHCSASGCSLCAAPLSLHNKQCTACTVDSSCKHYSNTCACTECEDGFNLRDGKCSSGCYKFVQSGEASARFDDTYTRVKVQFTSIVVTTHSDCSKLLNLEFTSLLGEGFSCQWTDSYTLEIFLGRNYAESLDEIALQPIERAEGECATQAQTLLLSIKSEAPKPIPEFSVTSSEVYSLACATDNLVVSVKHLSGICNHSPTYDWLITGPENFSKTYSEASVSLEKGQLAPGDYAVSVTVTNIFGSSQTRSHSFQVVKDAVLGIEIDSGSEAFMKSSDSRVFTATVTQFCGAGSVEFEWKMELSSEKDYSSVIKNSLQPHRLQINSNDLVGASAAAFKVVARQNEYVGEAHLIIYVASTELVAKINHSGGVISIENDLFLSAAQSYDPEAPTDTEFTYKWECKEAYTSKCSASDGSPVIFRDDTDEMTIPKSKLKAGSHYTFFVTVSKGLKSSVATTELDAVTGNTAGLTSATATQLVNPQKEVILRTELHTDQAVQINWRQTHGTIVEPSSSTDFPYLRFAPNTLAAGQHYTFEVTVHFEGSIETAKYNVQTTTGPLCMKGLQTLPHNSLHSLALPECTDNEELYPLKYSFGLQWKQFYLPLMTGSNSDFVNVKLPTGTTKCVGIVCDRLDTCKTYSTSVTTGPERLLSDLVIDTFDGDTRNPDMIPLVAYTYVTSYALTAAEWQYILNVFRAFIEARGQLDYLASSTGLACFVGFATTAHSLGDIQKVLEVAHSIIKNTVSKLSPADAQLVFEVLELVHSKYGLLDETRELVRLVLTNLMRDVPPNDFAELLSSLSLSTYAQQLLGSSLQAKTISFSDVSVTLPSTLPFDATDVVTLEVAAYQQLESSSDCVELNFLRSGSYSSYQYNAANPELTEIRELTEPIQLTFPCAATSIKEFACAHYQQHSWKPSCELVYAGDGRCTIQSFHASLFSVVSVASLSESCQSSFTPAYTLGIIYAVAFVLYLLGQRKHQEVEEDDEAIKVYALESNFMDEPSGVQSPGIRSPREIVIVESKQVNSSDFEDIITPEFRANSQNFGDAEDEESELSQIINIEIKNSCSKFLNHHLVLGQTQEYFYPSSCRQLLLLLNATLTFALTGVMVGLDELQTPEDYLFIGVVAMIGSLVVVSTLEYLLAAGRNCQPASPLGLALGVSFLLGALAYVLYLMVTECAELTLLWNRVATLTVTVDFVVLQSLIALIKASAVSR